MTTQQNMMQNGLSQLSQQEIHHLITVSTGIIDVYVLEAHLEVPLLLPQNIVISVFDAVTGQTRLSWRDQDLAVWAVHTADAKQALALVIEGEEESQRFIVLCDHMPEALRLRISEVIDDEQIINDPRVFKYVKRGEQRYIVPNLHVVAQQLAHISQ